MSTTASCSASSFSSAAASSSDEDMEVVEPWQSKRTRTATTSVPELLRMRQTHGAAFPGHSVLIGATARRGAVSAPYLASRGAWNARRLQNTILLVGPGTPASVVAAATNHTSRRSAPRSSTGNEQASASTFSSAASSHSSSDPSSPSPLVASRRITKNSSDDNEEPEEHEEDMSLDNDHDCSDDNDVDEDESSRDSSRRRHSTRRRDDDGDDEDGDEGAAMEEIYEFLAARGRARSDEDEDDDSDDDSTEARLFRGLMGRRRVPPAVVNREPHYCPSMRHGGCINTAAWLDTGWQLSTVNHSSGATVPVHGMESDECPTQLVTSGDDHLVKFWDVREAMGTISPLGGGRATLCPFSASKNRNPREMEDEWQSMYESRNESSTAKEFQNNEFQMPGSVRLMSTLRSGHQENVFHVTPVEGRPGVVATCGADGFLRLTSMESGESSIVVNPEFEDEISGMLPAGLLSLRSAICYSHHFMNRNVGVLCSDRGLRRFDLRLPPREQSTQRLLSGTAYRTCKACAILSSPPGLSNSTVQAEESSYVFVGGSSRMVALCDLRMTDDSQNRVVQTYCPSGLSPADHVSVSGLDLSRDRQELLVSYESDQIYTFPIFPNSNSKARSIMSQVEELEASAESSMGSRGRVIKPLNELATYGAHLNRFTFLKNARYAGPRDEYICTGSDSGHAWVYEKATGTVASFWMADNSTCNGVIPHPTLPVFVTYGIDSTAKLWRSTVPVDRDTDDSAIGRRQRSRIRRYDISPTVRSWNQVESVLENLDLRDGGVEQTDIFPDHIPSTKVLMRRGRLARTWLRDAVSSSRGTPRIGNDLHNLEQTLKDNLYTCLRSLYDDDDVPVESDIDDLKHRVSLIRLRYQADRLGLRWNLSVPWAMESEEVVVSEHEKLMDVPEDHNVACSDLVPDYPSDWMPNDPEMSSDPFDFCNIFNVAEYADFYRERYLFLNERNALRLDTLVGVEKDAHICEDGVARDSVNVDEDSERHSKPIRNETKAVDGLKKGILYEAEGSAGEAEETAGKDSPAKDILLKTMCALKDGGNAALKAGHFDLAGHRYDKAIQYAAMLYMKSPDADGGKWNPLRKTLVITRLNLALLLLKPHFGELQIATNQAKAALRDLSPFEHFDGCDNVLVAETRDEILSLQAKAYFRMGTAQFEMGDYGAAIESFNESIKSTRRKCTPNSKPDQLVFRRLAEAKREQAKQSKRQRKKFKRAFASTISPFATSPPSPASSSASSSVDAPGSPARNNSVAVVCTRSDTASSARTAVVSNKKSPPPGPKSSGTGETARF